MLNYTIVAPRPSLRLGLFLCFFFLLLTDLRTGLALGVVQRSYSCVMEHDDALSTDLERDPLDDDYSGYLWLPCSCSIVFSLSPVSTFFSFLCDAPIEGAGAGSGQCVEYEWLR